MNGNSSNRTHGTLDDSTADRVLDLLGTDDTFRERFQANPAAALASIGYEPAQASSGQERLSRGDAFFCMTAEQLASKDEINASREQLRTYLTSQTDHSVIHAFESGKVGPTLSSK